MDTDKVKIFGARVRVDGTGKLAELERAEKEKMKDKVNKIAAHGITCFVNRQLIYNYPESLLSDQGIMSIEHADFEGVERLALVTGGEIASTFDQPESAKIGQCDLIEEIMIGEDKVSETIFRRVMEAIQLTGASCWWQLIKFSGVAAGEACTVVLRGATTQMVDEAERSLHDALSVLSQTVKETRVVLGGGCSEMLMSCAVEEEGRRIKGKKALAVESFGKALRQVRSRGSLVLTILHSKLTCWFSVSAFAFTTQIPTILADNGGHDSSDLVAKLRAAHYEGQTDAGLGKSLLVSGRQGGYTNDCFF